MLRGLRVYWIVTCITLIAYESNAMSIKRDYTSSVENIDSPEQVQRLTSALKTLSGEDKEPALQNDFDAIRDQGLFDLLRDEVKAMSEAEDQAYILPLIYDTPPH